MATRGERFLVFKKETSEFLGYTKDGKGEQQPFWAVMFKIVEDEEDFTFDSVKMRASCDLIVGAMLLAVKKCKRTVFLCPTIHHGALAMQVVKAFQGTKILRYLDICPAEWVTSEVAEKTDVFLHHGKRFDLPAAASKARHVVQIFDLTGIK